MEGLTQMSICLFKFGEIIFRKLKDSFLLLGHLNNIAADKMLLPNMKRRLD